MGKGIGFRFKKGDLVPFEAVEKTFLLDSMSQSIKTDYIHLFEDVPEQLIMTVKTIIDYANLRFNSPLNKNLFFTLVDHLNQAIDRAAKGIVFQNKLLIEIQKYYPKEYQIGCYAIEMINKELGVSLPDEEAGNIAFHIVNAQFEQSDVKETVLSIRMLKDMLMMLSYLFPTKKIDTDSMLYLRMVTHLQFFITRMIHKEQLPNKDSFLLDSVKLRFPQEYSAALKLKDYVEKEVNTPVNSDELLYLTLHISRVYWEVNGIFTNITNGISGLLFKVLAALKSEKTIFKKNI